MTPFLPLHEEGLQEVGLDFSRESLRSVASEVAVALTFNGVAHVVMFMTPQDVEDFVLGFALTEGIVGEMSELTSLDITEVPEGLVASAQIPKGNFERVIERRRNLPGQTGCGICGVVELEQAMRPLPKIDAKLQTSRAAIFRAQQVLRSHQVLNQKSGAVHGAAFVSPNGDILALREDIGRHNALDKLIGHMARQSMSAQDGFLLMTSRCSVELIQKAVLTGFPLMVTISAPTGLALDLARKSGLGLVCIAREDSFLVCNDPVELFST